MKKNLLLFKKLSFACILLPALIVGLSACGESENQGNSSVNAESRNEDNTLAEPTETEQSEDSAAMATQLEVRFGDEGAPFIMHLDDNDTAKGIARSVGTSDWRLPIYQDDDFENADVMQYYDIPSRYEIPYVPETITAEKAGEVYYSEPNRILLFYQDAEVQGEYTKIGTFDYSEEFLSAVENNPTLEGWSNKVVLIRR